MISSCSFEVVQILLESTLRDVGFVLRSLVVVLRGVQDPKRIVRFREFVLLLGPILLGIIVELADLFLYGLYTVAEVTISQDCDLLRGQILACAGAGIVVRDQPFVTLCHFDGTADGPSLT